jgi:hypothetical protein
MNWTELLRQLITILLALHMLFFLPNAYAVLESHQKIWLPLVVSGPISTNKKLTYFFSPEPRFIDSRYAFQEYVVWTGLGYRLNPHLKFYVGDMPEFRRIRTGKDVQLNTLWQQASWLVYRSEQLAFISRTRMEEIKHYQKPLWADIFRERLQLNIPIPNWKNHALIMSNELFFNVKHPKWVESSYLITQNRALIGLETLSSEKRGVAIIVGYLNQAQFARKNQRNNVLFISISVNFNRDEFVEYS